ncbi:MAG: hypothetical protein MK479_10135 [Planctomycetes bacterium]|nr:hypothetical protein [Planctomycetota bacterium]
MTSICPAIKKSAKTGWAAAPDTGAIQITRDRKGARVIDGEILLNRLLKEPGPADTLFDALAASISCLCKGHRLGVLGFGAGGFVAPLRALECDCRLVGCRPLA